MELGASLRLDHELLAVEADHVVHCMLELTAPAAPSRARQPLHLALVIDRSGSMAGPKLEAAKACAGYLARRLAPTDQLAVITYDDEVRLEHPLQDLGHGQLALQHAIAGISPGGMTNLSGGWLKAVEQLRAVPGGAGPKRVLLLSDGLANQGITDAAALVAMTGGASDEGVATTTIGFGEGFDEDLMTAMADAGVGNAYFAETHEEAPAIFAAEFDGLVSLVAQTLSVELRPGPDVQVLGVLNDWPQVPVPGGVQVQIGDAYAEERRRVVFELQIPRLAQLGVTPVAQAIVRYVSLGANIEAHELTLPVVVNAVGAEEAAVAGPDAEVTEEVVVLKAARTQEEARRRAMDGDGEGAVRLLWSAAAELKRVAPGSERADDLARQAEELEELGTQALMSPHDPSLNKKLRYSAREKQRSRPRPTQP
ncbi:MAG: VWA domain-containing protein [Actinobacteria bacterium]|nr:VWA domain-containing protein [Actinomycetota bacterium]